MPQRRAPSTCPWSTAHPSMRGRSGRGEGAHPLQDAGAVERADRRRGPQRDGWWWGWSTEGAAAGAGELQAAVVEPFHPPAAVMDPVVVVRAQQGQVVQIGGAAVLPPHDVMSLAPARRPLTPRPAAPTIPDPQRPPLVRRRTPAAGPTRRRAPSGEPGPGSPPPTPPATIPTACRHPPQSGHCWRCGRPLVQRWCSPPQGPPFKPCMRFSRTRLADVVHRQACAVPWRTVPVSR